MSWVVEVLNRWGTAWTSLVGVALWQSTLIALVVVFAALALRRSSPAVRYWLWQLVALKLLLFPLGYWSIALPFLPADEAPADVAIRPIVGAARDNTRMPVNESRVPSERGVEVGNRSFASPALPARTMPSANASYADLNWQAWLLVVWTIVVGLQLIRLLLQHRALKRLLMATHEADAAFAQIVASVAGQLGLRNMPAVCTTDRDCSPLVCGLRRPTLIVPRELIATLQAVELRQVVAHELAHLKRHDLLWGWLTEAARMLFFFHPVIHWAAYQVRLERELACDAVAMRTCGRTAAEYAQTLVRVLGTLSSPPALGAAAASLDGGHPLRSGEDSR